MSDEITPFEAIRRTNPAGNEYWSSRDFARACCLGFAGGDWERVLDLTPSRLRAENNLMQLTTTNHAFLGGDEARKLAGQLAVEAGPLPRSALRFRATLRAGPA